MTGLGDRPYRVALVLGAALVLIIAGCSPSPSASSFPPASVAQRCALTGGDMEGCYTSDQMEQFLIEGAHALVYSYVSDTYRTPPYPGVYFA